MDTSIDVIIPTFCRPLLAERLAASLVPQLIEGDRIIVVWQGTRKPDIWEKQEVRLVHSSPPSLPRARNAGIRSGRGGIVLFLDDDVTVLPGLLDGHRRAYGDAVVAAVAGAIEDPLFDKAEYRPAFFDEATGRLVQNFCVEQSQYTVSLMGANMSFRRDAIERIGLFDENFSHNALWEEVDAAFRLRETGHAIWYCATAMVKHQRQACGGCRADGKLAYLYHQFANTAYFAARHSLRGHRRSWFTYWKYRLEFESRKKALWLRHDPLRVAAGVFGAAVGLIRYAMWGRR